MFSGIGNMFSSFMHPEKGYEDAEKQFRKFWEEAKGNMQPFINQGQAQYGNLMGAENALLNPETLLKKWMSGYEESPFAKQSMANARSGGLDAASSMGLMGSSSAIGNIQNSASNIMNQDRSEYLKDLMDKYIHGVDIGKSIYGTGANIASQFGQLAHGFGQDIGGAAYGSANAPGNLLGNLINMGANIYSGGKAGNAFGGSGSNRSIAG